MAIVSITEASKLTKKSIPTLYRHIKSGKLSKTGDGVDTSELVRVYGNLSINSQDETVSDNNDVAIDKAELSILKREIELLRVEVEDLKKDKADAREREERLFKIIEHRLPAPDEPVTFLSKVKKLF